MEVGILQTAPKEPIDQNAEISLDVLLVEDNTAHAQLVTRWLEDRDFVGKIFHVTDGEAALDYLFQRGEYSDSAASPRPRVVLLDLRLPKVDGLEVLRQIKSTPSLASIPVIILTTSSAQGDLTQAYQSYVNSYLVKPMDYERFEALMDNIGYYWLSLNHPIDED